MIFFQRILDLPLWQALFFIGCFFLPFDNLKFSPSDGWAAISPYIFLLSFICMLFSKSVLLKCPKWLFLFLCSFVIYSIFLYLLLEVALAFVVKDLIKLVLGFSFYSVFFGFLICCKEQAEKLRALLDLLFFSYFLAVVVGLLQFLLILTLGGHDIIFDSIFNRVYGNKVQFTFTEPSFASLHVFGVMLPVSMILLSLLDDFYGVKRFLVLAFVMFFLSVVSGSSLRMLVDFCAIFFFAVVILFQGKKRLYMLLTGFTFFCVTYTVLPDAYVNRVEAVFFGASEGLVDPSTAIRSFRVEAAIFGMLELPETLYSGYGFGNSVMAMNNGFDEAYNKLAFTYSEIEMLRDRPDGLTYSLPVKLFVELGVVFFLAFVLLMYRGSHSFMFCVAFWSSVQFDSLAFYVFWIYLLSIKLNLLSNSDLKTILVGVRRKHA